MSSPPSSPHYDRLVDYYQEQALLPTYGKFKSADDFEKYRSQRACFLTQRLFLPSRFFREARLIEFGPDSGENALSFAAWGASCFLVEPNQKAHPFLLDNFKKFDLLGQLEGLSSSDVTAFCPSIEQKETFDVVDAEGFIYTVRPEKPWMDLFASLLKPGGVVILSYMEANGSFFELFLRAIQTHVRRLTGRDSVSSARSLFLAKWNSIPHTRSFESWVMDVLENPFIRLPYLVEPPALCESMGESGFNLYSSWPPYRNPLELGWHKTPVSTKQLRMDSQKFIEHNAVSHFFGAPFFSLRETPLRCIKAILHCVDGLIDRVEPSAVSELHNHLEELKQWLEGGSIYMHPIDLKKATRALSSVEGLLEHLLSGNIPALEGHCNSDRGFIDMWGMPVHYSVFEKS